MPSPTQILEGLHQIANDWVVLAVLWHAFFALLVASAPIFRPERRLLGALMAPPLASVSVLAWLTANPFNGTLFAVASASLLLLSLRLPKERVSPTPGWPMVAGAFMFLFGWGYPHFLDADSNVVYLYAAPTGLIPCPTLSILIGLALMFGPWDRAWSAVIVLFGLLYGAIGAVRLGVTIDGLLVLGALLFAVREFRSSGSDRGRHFGTNS